MKRLFFLAFYILYISSTATAETNINYFFKSDAQYQDVVVEEVRSANTIVLKAGVGEKGEVIRLIGLRAPQSPKSKTTDIKRDEFGFTIEKPVSPLTPLEDKAIEYVKELLEGQHVRLEFDSDKNSKDYSTLAYVFLLKDNTLANTEILRNGHAFLSIRPPNMKYAQQLREAYREARKEKRGLQGQY